jgi:signal transduction histidine kinase/FixJ family two-component response regulator
MTQALKVLFIEDSEDDAFLLARELRRGSYDLVSQRVETAEAMRSALVTQSWDLILSDYSMPHFRGTDALELLNEMGLDIPFIFVSGTIDEETAVEAMKAGAHDYMMKGNIKRLVPAVARELAEAEIRRKRKQAEKELRLRDARIRALHEINTAITSTLDLCSVLNILLEKIDLLLPYSAATIGLYDKRKRFLEPVACRNLDRKEWKLNSSKDGPDPARTVFETGSPLVIKDLQADSRVQAPEFYREHRLLSYMGIPLIAKQEIFGTLGFYTREEHEFSEDEVEFLNTLASQVAVAIHNSRLYEEIKFQAAELEKANQVKADFLSIMSHELRTPINVMMGYVELVQAGLLGEIKPEQNEALKKSLHHSRNLLGMVTDILQATRIQAQDIKLENSNLNLERIIDDLRVAYEVSSKKELTLVWDISFNLPAFQTDANKLKQILQGLIDNAIKFTDTGSIRITARHLPETNELKIQVSDTGRGIAEDMIPVIFDLFRQGDSSTTRRHGGMGLGLYLIKKTTELLGGRVTVESELGKGSTFTLILPVGAAESE